MTEPAAEESAMQGLAVLLTAGSLLVLAGCTSELDACRRAYLTGSTAYKTCRRAALQRQSEQLDRIRALEFRSRD
jgi:hypothetical protein